MSAWTPIPASSLAAALVAGAVSGCAINPPLRCDGPVVLASGEAPDLAPFEELPRARVGCLPFPGPFTLFAGADPASLGDHRYEGLLGTEVDRGIVYTARAGFIDVAHMRKAIDLTAYFACRFDVALREGWPCLQMRSREPSVYRVDLAYPPAWDRLAPDRKASVARELSIRLGQRLAVKALTWHEIITWFGYKSTVVLPENASAFAYDDPPSHVVGALIAGDALRTPDRDFDAAVTATIARVLSELGAADPATTDRAIRAVEGRWWRDGSPERLFLDEGIEDPLRPWTVDGLAGAAPVEPCLLQVPSLEDVGGIDFRGMMRVTIDPRILETGAIVDVLPGRPARIDADRDFPLLLAHIGAHAPAAESSAGRDDARPDERRATGERSVIPAGRRAGARRRRRPGGPSARRASRSSS